MVARILLKNTGLTLLPMLLFATSVIADDRPNILWITAEDMSPTLGCYGDDYAVTPHIDRLASQSVRYTHVFATAPVCSPVRSTLITGCYAPSTGTHNMRSAFPLPTRFLGFPQLLREAGYYTSNNVKTDYNTSRAAAIIRASWDESSDTAHWRNRADQEQPFFSVFNLMTSHQSRSMVWPRAKFESEIRSSLRSDQIHDPATAPLPPYYPDTPVIRREWARYYDCVTAMDQQVGAILAQLEEDGLSDRTIVFFFSDHGSGMPRHKRALLDSGMRVPLLIRFPARFRELAPQAAGKTVARLTSFIDFPPTVLALAGVAKPETMQGSSFLGSEDRVPGFVFGHRDRVDEAFDVARSARSKRYLYIRNYMPHLSYNQPTAWPDQGEIRHEFYRLADADRMTAAQWHFAGPTRPPEELYDCESDPQNLTNLAGSSEHAILLDVMRTALAGHLRTSCDYGAVPESELWRLIGETSPWDVSQKHAELLADAWAAADSVGASSESALVDLLNEERPVHRYWGAIGLIGSKTLSADATDALQRALTARTACVRIEAAHALVRHGAVSGPATDVLVKAIRSSNLNDVLHAMRTIELLGERVRSVRPHVERLAERCRSLLPTATTATFVQTPEQDLAMFIGFSAGAFLGRTGSDGPNAP